MSSSASDAPSIVSVHPKPAARGWSATLENGLVLAFLIAAAVYCFWPARVDWPENDHVVYLIERDMVPSNTSWFLHSISYSRTRFRFVGDYFAFRPAHFVFLVMQDIFLRERIDITGLFTFIYHGFAAFSIYLLVKRLAGRLLAIPFAVAFLAGLAGSRIVIWRHISPYLLALAFLGIGLALFSRSETSRNSRSFWAAAAALLLATLFHEFVFVGLVCAIPFLVAPILLSKGEGASRARRMAWVVAVPVAANACLNAIDILIYKPPSLMGPGDHLVSRQISAFVEPVLKMLSISSVALVVPPGSPTFHYWRYIVTFPTLSLVLGIGLGILATYVFVVSYRDYHKGSNVHTSVIGIILTCSLAALVVGIGVGRGAFRGSEYLRDAQYYASMADYVSLLIVAVFVSRLMKGRARAARYVFAIGFSVIAIANFVQLRKAIALQYTDTSVMRQFLKTLRQVQAEDICIAGYDPVAFNGSRPVEYSLLFSYRCGLRQGTPVYLTTRNNSVALAKATAATTEALPVENFNSHSAWIVGGDPSALKWSIAPRFDRSAVSTNGPFGGAGVAVRVHEGRTKDGYGLAIGLPGDGNYFQFVVEGHKVHGEQIMNGRVAERLEDEFLPLNISLDRLTVRCSNGDAYFFLNEYLLQAHRGLCPLDKVGFFAETQGDSGLEFLDPRVVRDAVQNAPNLLEPVIERSAQTQ